MISRDNLYCSENNIMKLLRLSLLDKKSVYPVNISSGETTKIIRNILDEGAWTDSSGKGDPPPDFYSEIYSMMAEVMSVSDNEFEDGGKIINPTAAKMSEMFRELQKSGALDGMREDLMIGINAITDLPTEKDHNYGFYKRSLNRVVRKHVQQIPAYRRNHPGKKLLFIIYDESTAYMEAVNEEMCKNPVKGQIVGGTPHLWFKDKGLTDSFLKKGIDCIIWFTPCKSAEDLFIGQVPFPRVCIFDGSKDTESRTYQTKRMISSEI